MDYENENGNKELWKLIEELYPPGMADKISLRQILKLVAMGFTNKEIEGYTGFPEEFVRETNNRFFEFDGWEETLPVSPLVICRERGMDIFIKTDELPQDLKDIAIRVCDTYIKVTKEIDDYYKEGTINL